MTVASATPIGMMSGTLPGDVLVPGVMAIGVLAVMLAVPAVEPPVTVRSPNRIVAHGVTRVMRRNQVVEHRVSNVEHFDRGQSAELTLEGVPEVVARLRGRGCEQPRTRQGRQCADRSERKVESLRIHDVSSLE